MRAFIFVALVACGGSPATPAPVIANATPVAAPAPAPKSRLTLEPDKGDADGGTYVRIIGSGFLTDEHGNPSPTVAKIYFGSVQGEVVRFVSDSEIIVQAPGGKAGETVDALLIIEGRGEMKIPKAFTFVEHH